MKAVRIWFQKIGSARYISHLDLNRCMSRAFHKAKIPLWYTQGFNPHAFLTFALPLSLGISGERESMDIKLDDDCITREELIDRLNFALPEDIPVFDVTQPVMKPGEIAYASYVILLDADPCEKENTAGKISQLFQLPEIVVPKRTKNGLIDLDIRPYLDQTEVHTNGTDLEIKTLLPAGSTININPTLLLDAVRKYLNLDLFSVIKRTNLYNSSFEIFE